MKFVKLYVETDEFDKWQEMYIREEFVFSYYVYQGKGVCFVGASFKTPADELTQYGRFGNTDGFDHESDATIRLMDHIRSLNMGG